jgi:hypothetical protein
MSSSNSRSAHPLTDPLCLALLRPRSLLTSSIESPNSTRPWRAPIRAAHARKRLPARASGHAARRGQPVCAARTASPSRGLSRNIPNCDSGHERERDGARAWVDSQRHDVRGEMGKASELRPAAYGVKATSRRKCNTASFLRGCFGCVFFLSFVLPTYSLRNHFSCFAYAAFSAQTPYSLALSCDPP